MHKEAVLISIRPKYAGEIFHGHKNVELRKTWPTALPLPFKAYVYCTQRQYTVMDVVHKGECVWNEDDIWESDTPLIIKIDKNTPDNMIDRLKMVVGVITVDKILEIDWKDGKSLSMAGSLQKKTICIRASRSRNFSSTRETGRYTAGAYRTTRIL